MKTLVVLFVGFIVGLTLVQEGFLSRSINSFPLSRLVYAEDAWRVEFDDICAKTNDSTELTKEELKALISRCDKLKPVIEMLDETLKKVYLRRLAMCRDMLIFALESKEKN